MSVFLVILVSLTALFVLHLVWWRFAVPRRQRSVLLLIFLAGGIPVAWAASLVVVACGLQPLSLVQWLNVGLAILAFTLAYVVTYSALEADSPTLSLVRHIAQAGTAGRSERELVDFIAVRPFVGARLAALVEEGMIIEHEGRIHLAGHSFTLFRIVLLHRERVLGIAHHGG